MKVRVRIEGTIDVPDSATTEQIEDAVYVHLGLGSMSVDNPVGTPDWDDADVEIY
jgi:hypothetical protein